MLLTYKALNGQAPTYLTTMLNYFNPPRKMCSLAACLLEIPRNTGEKIGDVAFRIYTPTLWNTLPSDIREANYFSNQTLNMSFYIGLWIVFIHFMLYMPIVFTWLWSCVCFYCLVFVLLFIACCFSDLCLQYLFHLGNSIRPLIIDRYSFKLS